MSRNVPSDVRPAHIQIRLRIRAVWSESSLGASRITKGAKSLHAANENSNKNVPAQRPIWVFVGRTSQKVRFLRYGSSVFVVLITI